MACLLCRLPIHAHKEKEFNLHVIYVAGIKHKRYHFILASVGGSTQCKHSKTKLQHVLPRVCTAGITFANARTCRKRGICSSIILFFFFQIPRYIWTQSSVFKLLLTLFSERNYLFFPLIFPPTALVFCGLAKLEYGSSFPIIIYTHAHKASRTFCPR